MELSERNTKIYEAFCSGARYKRLGIDFDLSESRIKAILRIERKRRGLKKEKGKRQ